MAKQRAQAGRIDLTILWQQLSENSVIAVTQLGGQTIRGERSDTPWAAVRSLFAGLAGRPEVSSHQDAAIALDLALAGTSIAALTAGSTEG